MSEIKKAISVRAPWSWAILHGKNIENRDWSTNFRGAVWLHSSKWWSTKGIEEDLEDVLYMAGESGLTLPPTNLQKMRAMCGCIVGSVEIVDCVKKSESPWFVGEYGFVLRNPVPLAEPVPCKGALGLFTVPDGLLGDAA